MVSVRGVWGRVQGGGGGGFPVQNEGDPERRKLTN